MDIKKIEEISRKIKIQLSKGSSSFYMGAYKTLFRGSGLTFKDHRTYNYQDDVRFLDWKIFAKTNRYYVKTFEEERNLDIAIIIDARNNMQYGLDGISKLRVAIEITILFQMIAEVTKDTVRPFLVTDKIIECPSGNGPKAVDSLIYFLKNLKLISPEGHFTPNYESKLHDQRRVETLLFKNLEKKRVLFVFSDFVDFLDIDFLMRVKSFKKLLLGRILSPLDEMEKFPYMITPIQNRMFSNSTRKNPVPKLLNEINEKLKFLTILTENDYLNKFVREVMKTQHGL